MGALRLRLLYVSPGYTSHDRRFLLALSAAGMKLTHARLPGQTLERRPPPPAVRQLELTVGAGAGGAHGLVRQLRQIQAQWQPAITMAGPLPSAAYLAARADCRPLLAVSWGSDLLLEAARNQKRRQRMEYALSRADGMFGDCQAVCRRARELSHLPSHRLLALPWGVDPRQFHPRPARNRRKRRAPVFICTRSWEPLYSIPTLLRAFARLRQGNPEARLILVGDGSQRPLILSLVRRLGLAASVAMPGRVPESRLPRYFRMADVYVSPSISDGSSVSLLQAMASGLPVIVVDAPGNREWVRPGRQGWLTHGRDVAALHKALQSACRRHIEGEMADWQRTNRACILQRADWRENAPKLVAFIRRLARPASGDRR